MKRFLSSIEVYSLKIIFTSLVIMAVFAGCEDKFENNPKYQRPEWLVGKIYSQISVNDSLSLFAQCMSDVGYDSLVNKSGAYAAFAPHNDAFKDYLSSKGYSTVENIPYEEKLRLVKYHLVQMPWNSLQLQGLSANGWISEDDISNNKPYAFKRQTLLKNSNKTYPISTRKEGIVTTETIVPENSSNGSKTVYANSRKYVPLFFDGFLAASNMSGVDYSFYFDRDYEQDEIFYAGAKIISDEIFSDNGFIYIVDKVIEPLKNVEEIMEEGIGDDSYIQFKELINVGSEFEMNEDATYAQVGADDGIEVEDLYDLTYPGIEFDIHQELTADPSSGDASNQTMENHFGIVVPTDQAMQQFVDEVVTQSGINGLKDIPSSLKKMIINSHMSQTPIYASDIQEGFYNAEGDYVELDESSIIQKEFGSNATFLGVDKLIVPKALSSVSGPLYLNPRYYSNLVAMEFADLTGALKAEDIDFSLFIIPENSLVQDMSLMVEWRSWRKTRYELWAYSYGEEKMVKYDRDEISEFMFNHIGIEPVIGVARKEFIETLNQKHIVIDNENDIISGGALSTFGYTGDSVIDINVTPIDGEYYNGKVYEMDGWLSFPSQTFLTKLYGTKFFDLLEKAGLATSFELRFINETDRYTVFLPSNEALIAAEADTLSGDDLKNFLLGHILKDELIFTDGRREAGPYKTLSKTSNTEYDELNITPGFDEIEILNSDYETVITIFEDGGRTNQIAVKTLNDQLITTAVIHEMDTVLWINR